MDRRYVTLLAFLTALLLLATTAQAQLAGAQVFVDTDGVRKVRVPLTQARSGSGVAWSITSGGRTVAYDSNTEYPAGGEGADEYKTFSFIAFGQPARRQSPPNPVDPYGFLFVERVDDDGFIYFERVAFTWSDYDLVVTNSIKSIEFMWQSPLQLSVEDDGRPVASFYFAPGDRLHTFKADLGTMTDRGVYSEVPMGLTSSTIIATAQKQNVPAGSTGAGQAAAPADVPDSRSAAEWLFYYDQVYMWNAYVQDEILGESTDGDSLMTMAPDELRQTLPSFYNDILSQRDRLAEDEHNDNLAFYDRMQEREQARERYNEWRGEEAERLIEFAEEQRRLIEGREVVVENRSYIISPEPLARVDEGRVNIVSESQLVTPYDLLTEDGELRSPYQVR